MDVESPPDASIWRIQSATERRMESGWSSWRKWRPEPSWITRHRCSCPPNRSASGLRSPASSSRASTERSSNPAPGQHPELDGDGLDAELHQEAKIFTREVVAHRGLHIRLRAVLVTPVGHANRPDEPLDIAALPGEEIQAGGAAVPKMENGVVLKLSRKRFGVPQPLLPMPVGEIAVHVVVRLISREHGLSVAEKPHRVVV